MKIISLDGSIDDFVSRIVAETNNGKSVIIRIPGSSASFKAVIYAWSSPAAIRRAVLAKLREIREYELNVKMLESVLPSDVLARYLCNATPDDVAELCFEQGYIGTYSVPARSI